MTDNRYPVNPPDLITIEVLESPPQPSHHRRASGAPDGTISLGFYGDVNVAGLTTPEIKTRVIEHLRQFLSDEQLGLIGPGGQGIEPEKSTAVAVDVVAYNSQVYYIQGAVAAPGRLHVTGFEDVLDALNYSGGLISDASKTDIHLIRPRDGQPPLSLKVDYDAILSGDDSTNYALQPNDRLIVPQRPKPSEPDDPAQSNDPETILRNLDTRLKTLESKLDRLIELHDDNP